MRLNELCLLPFDKQSKVLYEDAVFIGKRKINGKYHVLFQLDKFYVEVGYKNYRQIIDRICYSDSTKFVEPYLQEIKIELPANV